jgi:hypothetical protein
MCRFHRMREKRWKLYLCYGSRDRFSKSLHVSNLPNPSCSTTALAPTKPLKETSNRNLPGGKARTARKADNLTVMYEQIVYKTWDPRRLTTLRAFTACYRDSFTVYCRYQVTVLRKIFKRFINSCYKLALLKLWHDETNKWVFLEEESA